MFQANQIDPLRSIAQFSRFLWFSNGNIGSAMQLIKSYPWPVTIMLAIGPLIMGAAWVKTFFLYRKTRLLLEELKEAKSAPPVLPEIAPAQLPSPRENDARKEIERSIDRMVKAIDTVEDSVTRKRTKEEWEAAFRQFGVANANGVIAIATMHMNECDRVARKTGFHALFHLSDTAISVTISKITNRMFKLTIFNSEAGEKGESVVIEVPAQIDACRILDSANRILRYNTWERFRDTLQQAGRVQDEINKGVDAARAKG